MQAVLAFFICCPQLYLSYALIFLCPSILLPSSNQSINYPIMPATSEVEEEKKCNCGECQHEPFDLLAANKAWAAENLRTDPEFFSRLTAVQKPDYLWIGCADSRVPANHIIGRKPGEIFVHRNVANLLLHMDLNALSVLQVSNCYR